MSNPDNAAASGLPKDDNDAIDSEAMDTSLPDTSLPNTSLPDTDRQLVTDSAAIDEGQANDSALGADVAGDIGPKHP